MLKNVKFHISVTLAKMECIVCFELFDEGPHRPKVLPCGHSLCSGCVGNSELKRRCPEDRKEYNGSAKDLPDNFTVLRMLDEPSARDKEFVRVVELLERGLAAGRRVQQLLDEKLISQSVVVDDWHKRCDEVQNSLQRVQALGRVSPKEARTLAAAVSDTVQRLEGGDHLLSNAAKCYVIVEDAVGRTLTAALPRSELPVGLLLRLREDGRLLAGAPLPSLPWQRPPVPQHPLHSQPSHLRQPPPLVQPQPLPHTPLQAPEPALLQPHTPSRAQTQSRGRSASRGAAAASGPTKVECLDLNGKGGNFRAKRKDLLQIRKVTGLDCQYDKSYSLLCNLAAAEIARLEELQMLGARSRHMVLLTKFPSLRTLDVTCSAEESISAALPKHLEELLIQNCSSQQLASVADMPRLKKLQLLRFMGPDRVAFPVLPGSHCGLQWLRVEMDSRFATTIFSLLRAQEYTLKTLRLAVASMGGGDFPTRFSIPDLAQEIGDCGFRALSLMILERKVGDDVALLHDADSCSKQVKECRAQLARRLPGVTVACSQCNLFGVVRRGNAWSVSSNAS